MTMLVIKRDGSREEFMEEKIVRAVMHVLGKEGAEVVIRDVVKEIGKVERISVEEIQDLVEKVLMRYNEDAAKRYILYRKEREKDREAKATILREKGAELDRWSRKADMNQVQLLARRYLRKGENPTRLFERVAYTVAVSEIIYHPKYYDKDKEYDNLECKEILIDEMIVPRYAWDALKRAYNRERKHIKISLGRLLSDEEVIEEYKAWAGIFFKLMYECKFMPNTPCLMNAGTKNGGLSACFVLPMEDNMESIMKAVMDSALIYKTAGGVGVNASRLRAEGSVVDGVEGAASGPISFLSLIDYTTNVVKSGGKRRGANMGILEWWHPDIEKFITCKADGKTLQNFNISVLVDNEFWNDERGKELLKMIAYNAWRYGDPNLIFKDNINRYNPLRGELGDIDATNPCSEISMYPHESCNLASINLARIEGDGELYEVARMVVRFLDDMVTINKFPTREIEEQTLKMRRIGLGVMGFADLLLQSKVKYASEEAEVTAETIAKDLTNAAMDESITLAKTRGAFPLFYKVRDAYMRVRMAEGIRCLREGEELRHCSLTTVAPTGSISMIAGCSSGIEPLFTLEYRKNTQVGEFHYRHWIVDKEEIGHYIEDGMLPERVKKEFGLEYVQTALDGSINVEWHIRIQAAWQRGITNAISKTINMPSDATVEDVIRAYRLAHDLGCKGVTIYRDGSKGVQVLEKVERCQECKGELVNQEGCKVCKECGWQVCSI